MPLLVVYLLVRAYWLVYDASGPALDPLWAQTAAQLVMWVPASFAITMVWQGASLGQAWRDLGLGHGVGAGLAFGLLVTAPMAVAVMIGGGRWPQTETVVAHSLLGPFAESVLFSGFLFTQLVARARWQAPAAIIMCAVVFGLAHVENVDMLLAGSVANVVAGAGPDLLVERILPAVAATGVGGLLFTWIYYRWGTLWPAIGLHATMNFWWAVSGEGIFQATFARAVATPLAIAQAVSMGLAVVATIAWARRHPALHSSRRPRPSDTLTP